MSIELQRLLKWYAKNKRSLPWRTTRNAYRIFISELMLQQTQVSRVIPKYQAWLQRFPSWKSLADAKTADLIHGWAGLGYNRRALQAREAAQQVVREGVPTDEGGWRKLKGIGPYAAAALTEFVNHTRAVVIDTNVRRVAGRIFVGDTFPSPQIDEQLRLVLEQKLPKKGAHWDVPQAFMDLGSTICSVRAPQCIKCPLRKQCKAASVFVSATPPERKIVSKPHERHHRNKPYPDRIYRGRVLALLREKRIYLQKIGPLIDPAFDSTHDTAWFRALIERMEKDGLLVVGNRGVVGLPS